MHGRVSGPGVRQNDIGPLGRPSPRRHPCNDAVPHRRLSSPSSQCHSDGQLRTPTGPTHHHPADPAHPLDREKNHDARAPQRPTRIPAPHHCQSDNEPISSRNRTDLDVGNHDRLSPQVQPAESQQTATLGLARRAPPSRRRTRSPGLTRPTGAPAATGRAVTTRAEQSGLPSRYSCGPHSSMTRTRDLQQTGTAAPSRSLVGRPFRLGRPTGERRRRGGA